MTDVERESKAMLKRSCSLLLEMCKEFEMGANGYWNSSLLLPLDLPSLGAVRRYLPSGLVCCLVDRAVHQFIYLLSDTCVYVCKCGVHIL